MGGGGHFTGFLIHNLDEEMVFFQQNESHSQQLEHTHTAITPSTAHSIGAVFQMFNTAGTSS